MQKYPISMIPYANMGPYEALGPPEGCYFVHSTPRNSIAALKSGAVWAAAVPVGGLAALEGVVVPLGKFGIAAYQQVMSVMFFSNQPFEEFVSPLTVRLTVESATSVRLLYLLMDYCHGREHISQVAEPGASPDGELVIGDTALKWNQLFEAEGQVKGFRFVTDLAARWDRHHGLPFVFARWVVRADAPADLLQSLQAWLTSFEKQEMTLVDRCSPATARRLDLPLDYMQRYHCMIRRCLTADDEAGQRLFLEHWLQIEQAGQFAWLENVRTEN